MERGQGVTTAEVALREANPLCQPPGGACEACKIPLRRGKT